jgi:transposase-like protein
MSRNQQKDKQKLLERLHKTPIVEMVCKQTGVPRSTYYRWRKEDTAFAEAADEALEHSSALINDLAESQLINAIKNQNMTAIIFWLKHHHGAYETRIKVDAKMQVSSDILTPEQAEIVSNALKMSGLLTSGEDNGS